MKVDPIIPAADVEPGRGASRPKTPEGATGETDGPARGNPPQPPPAASERIEALRDEIGKMLRASHSSVQLSFDKDLHRIIAKIVDDETGEVIRQYPPAEMLAVMKRLQELRGMLFDKKG